jgi:glutathione peroxidase
VTFPMFAKISVAGKDIAPLYEFLASGSTNPDFPGKIKWNFTKFLIDREGAIAARFEPAVEPRSKEVVDKVKELLA